MKKINPITNTIYANAIIFSMQKTMRPILFQFLKELGANILMKEKVGIDPLDLSTVIGLFGRISESDPLEYYHQYERCLRYTAAILLKRFRDQCGYEVVVHGYDPLFNQTTYDLSRRSDLESLVKATVLVA